MSNLLRNLCSCSELLNRSEAPPLTIRAIIYGHQLIVHRSNNVMSIQYAVGKLVVVAIRMVLPLASVNTHPQSGLC